MILLTHSLTHSLTQRTHSHSLSHTRTHTCAALFVYTDKVPVSISDKANFKSVYISTPKTLNLYGLDTKDSNTSVVASPA
jgi:hypothetical protein